MTRCAAPATVLRDAEHASTRASCDSVGDGIITTDADGIVIYANPAAIQMLGDRRAPSAVPIGRGLGTDAIAPTLRDGETRHVERGADRPRQDGVEQIVEYTVTADAPR